MSFGRRDEGQPYRHTQRHLNNSNSKGRTTSPASSSLNWGTVVTAVAVMVIVFSVGFISFALVKQGWFNSKPAPKTLAIFADEHEPVARVYRKTGKPLKRFPRGIVVTVRYRLIGEKIDPIDSELHERCMKPTNSSAARRVVEEGFAKLTTKEASKFLACTMMHQRSRFCLSRYRGRLISRLGHYLSVYHAEKRFLKMLPHSARRDNARMFSPSRARGGYIQLNQGAIVPEDLARRLASLSTLGLINPKDFVHVLGEIPEVLQPLLAFKPRPC